MMELEEDEETDRGGERDRRQPDGIHLLELLEARPVELISTEELPSQVVQRGACGNTHMDRQKHTQLEDRDILSKHRVLLPWRKVKEQPNWLYYFKLF